MQFLRWIQQQKTTKILDYFWNYVLLVPLECEQIAVIEITKYLLNILKFSRSADKGVSISGILGA